MLVLTVLQGPDKGRRFQLPDDEPQLIGRSSEALDLSDQTISRRHAELTPDPDEKRWYIADLRSSNGTFVNGVRVSERRQLKAGDQIRTGTTLLVFGEQPGKPKAPAVRGVGKAEMEVSFEKAVASNEDSMIMSVDDPAASAQFQLKVIYELTAVISSVTRRQELLERVMDVVFEYFNADRGFILLLADPAHPTRSAMDAAVVRHRHGPDRDNRGGHGGRPATSDDGKPLTYSKTIVQYVLRKHAGVLSSNAMTDERFAGGDSIAAFHIRSAMCVPIHFKDRLYGVIHLDSQVKNYTYTEDQLTLLTAVGVHTGMALSNVRLVAARLRHERLAAVGQTVASLSHSIKNILQGMRGGADVVELGLKKDDISVVRNGWGIVDRNLDRIYGLAMNMLAFSKQRKPDIELENLPALLKEVEELALPRYDAKQVALLFDVDEEMPPVPIDAGGVHQAVLNLLNNALDAVEPESGAVSVLARYRPKEEQVEITVSDNGHGIPAEVRRRLFEPFQSTKGYQGTGLGLVVTKKVVEEHGGSVQVDSQANQGTKFTLLLPANTDAVPESADTHH